MNLTSLFEKTAGRQRQRQKAKHDDYRNLVSEIADGREPDAEVVDRVLYETGKTLDDLRSAVELFQRRRQLRRQYDQIPKLASEREEIEKQIAAADSVLEAAKEHYTEVTAPLYGRLANIKKAIRSGQEAGRELEDTCADEGILAEYELVTTNLRDIQGRRANLQKETRELRQWADSDRDESRREMFPNRIEQLQDRAEEREEKADQKESELEDVFEQIAELERHEQAIRKQMLDP